MSETLVRMKSPRRKPRTSREEQQTRHALATVRRLLASLPVKCIACGKEFERGFSGLVPWHDTTPVSQFVCAGSGYEGK